MYRCLLVVTLGALLVTAGANGDDTKKDVAKVAGGQELEKLLGTWEATSWQRGDGEIGRDQVATELVFTKEAYAFPKGINRISQKGKFKIDSAKGTIDFTPDDGPAQGKTLLGIYKVEGNTLKMCFRPAGRERPTEFKSTDRSTVLASYERKKA